MLSGCALFFKDTAVAVGGEPSPLPDYSAQVKLDKQWSAKVGSGVGDSYLTLIPAIDGKMIYAADVNGVLAAFERSSGKRQWRINLKEPLSGGVGAGFGVVLVGTDSGYVLALHQADGSELWRARVASEILSAPKTNASTVVVQTLDDKVYGFDHATGEQRWQYEGSAAALSLRGASSPVVTSEVVIAGMSNGQIVALNPDTGALLWKQRATVPQGRSEFERMSDVDGDLLLAGDTLYATSFQGYVAAFNVSTGQSLWRHKLSSFHGADEGLGNLYVSGEGDGIHALDQVSHEKVWSQAALKNRKITAPVTFSNYLAVADSEGYVHVISQRNGDFVARKKIDGSGISTSLLAKGKTLYIYSNSGKLVALTAK
jgi:outer membrane protein assembly factor BamB